MTYQNKVIYYSIDQVLFVCLRLLLAGEDVGRLSPAPAKTPSRGLGANY